MPVPLPGGVEVAYRPGYVRVAGPKGALERTIPEAMTLTVKDHHLLVQRPSDSRSHRSLHGLTRTLVANMVVGVTEGFSKSLEIHGVGYRTVAKGEGIELSLGYSHPISYPAPPGITLEVAGTTKITVAGADKALVGQVAAEIRALRPPDPYKQKGVRYAGELIRKKAGKTAKGIK